MPNLQYDADNMLIANAQHFDAEVSSVLNQLANENRELHRARSLIRSLNERLKQEVSDKEVEKSKALEAAEAKSLFLASMNHELRTPLNAVIGFANLLKDGHVCPTGQINCQPYLLDILHAADHLLDAINDILDISKIDSGKMIMNSASFDINHQLQRVVRLVSEDIAVKQIAVSFDLDASLSHIWADPAAVKRVVSNIISNAVKYNKFRGSIMIKTERQPTKSIITISDTGIGMSQDFLNRAGQPFERVDNSYTRSSGGTGLGLALASRLMKLHNGSLTIHSVIDIGSEVIIEFPTLN